jgi:outer membrane protein assembly factor BamB
VKPKKKLINALILLLILSLVIVQASSDKTRFGETRKLTLPAYSVLDENAQPLISASGKFGFISSITDGSLISFNIASGKILSSVIVGESVGPVSMIEANGRRLIAVPAANLPAANHPATVTIVDATKAKQLEIAALLALPSTVQITPTTQAAITQDAKFCVIASSFDEPTLYAFNIETGEIVSQFPLLGRPSEMVLYDDGAARNIAIASAVSNNVALVKLDEQGQLISSGNFSPADARFEEVNNPVFSTDGRTLYIAAAQGNKLFAVNATNGNAISELAIESPQRISVAPFSGNFEMLGVTRIRRPINAARGGVTIVRHQRKELAVQSEFTPPEGIEFSRSNNVVFNDSAASAFVGSTTGVLFAFSTQTGELESYQVIGNEIRRLVLTNKGKKVAAVRSNSGGDEVVLTAFESGNSESKDGEAPTIIKLKPDLVEQGYATNLRVSVQGENLTENDALLINGVEAATNFAKGGGLEAQLPKSLFKQTGEISVQIKRLDGATSLPVALRVVKPQAPVIDALAPERIPSPASAFTLQVKGSNFRESSAIFVNGQPLSTQRRDATELQAKVSKELARSVRQFAIEVRDLANPDLVSNAKTLNVVGPIIEEVKPFNDVVVAGDSSFQLRISGENFREGVRLQINNEVVPLSLTHRYNDKLIIANVPGRFAREAKSLSIVARNQSGDESNAVKVDARAPEITAFAQEQVSAGVKSAKVDIRGANFRRHASVYVGDGKGTAFKVSRRRVHFISSKQIIVNFTGVLKNLLAKPGVVQIQVVNPNDVDGVASQTQLLKVSAPEIAEAQVNPIEGDDSNSRLLIQGANFRRGAVVEFLKAGEVVRQQAPVNLRGNRITIVIQVKKLEALGSFEVRVINPGDIQSNAKGVNHEALATGNDE